MVWHSWIMLCYKLAQARNGKIRAHYFTSSSHNHQFKGPAHSQRPSRHDKAPACLWCYTEIHHWKLAFRDKWNTCIDGSQVRPAKFSSCTNEGMASNDKQPTSWSHTPYNYEPRKRKWQYVHYCLAKQVQGTTKQVVVPCSSHKYTTRQQIILSHNPRWNNVHTCNTYML